jgi:hypothetical protein
MRDGRYLAEHINHLGEPQAGPRGEVPAEFLPRLEAVPTEAGEQNRSRSRSAAPSLRLSPWLRSQKYSHSSTAEQERKKCRWTTSRIAANR